MIDLIKDFIPYFRELSTKQLKDIENISKVYTCKNGDIVYLQGEFCQNWVIVYSGSFLTRKKDNKTIISEKILLEGESFDFYSTIESSVTSMSLEAVGDSSILIIDMLGLKELSKKNPVIMSLIKLQLNENDSIIWNDNLMRINKTRKAVPCIIRKSILMSLVSILLGLFVLNTLSFIVLIFTNQRITPLLIFILIMINFTILILHYLNSRLTYIELNREFIVKKDFSLKKISSSNSTIPIDKLIGTKINFKNRFYKILKLGEISIESATECLVLNGIYKPLNVIDEINRLKSNRLNIDKAIQLSSFKYLFSKQNNLFFLETALENDTNSFFSFKKSPIYFLIRAVPSFFVFVSFSIIFYKLFNDPRLFFMNIFSLFVLLWFFIDWSNDKYAFEGNKVIDIEKKPFWGKEKRVEAEISSIQSIKKDQKNFLNILFNYGDIEVETFSGKIVYPSINNPDKVIDNLYLVKKYYHSKQESNEKLQRQEEFLNYTKYYQELTKS